MKNNFNNPFGTFAPLTGEHDRRFISASFANQDGTGDSTDGGDSGGGFFDTVFAGNLATALGTVGAAAFGAKTTNTGAPKPPPVKTTTVPNPPAPTKSKTIYWVIGISSAVLIIGGVTYAMTRKK